MRKALIGFGVFVLLVLVVQCPVRKEAEARREARNIEIWLKSGEEALYRANAPEIAVTEFRRVLEKEPSNYGATLQLAFALDRLGKPDEARLYWEKVLPMAESLQDAGTVSAARSRLGKPAPPPDARAAPTAAAPAAPTTSPLDTPEDLMKKGLDLLYAKRDPVAAAVPFRMVLQVNPTHYGATYQLACALDQAGKRAEARPLWAKVLVMAQKYDDAQTATTARTRLEQTP